ncbi:MAG: hypothetical protein IJE21_04355, partial [Alistipes sp.]|nr:hypothetical protein [Alistipes sp.]
RVNCAFSGYARLRLRGEQNKICFAEPKQPKAFEEGLSLEIPLVIQLLTEKGVSKKTCQTRPSLISCGCRYPPPPR